MAGPELRGGHLLPSHTHVSGAGRIPPPCSRTSRRERGCLETRAGWVGLYKVTDHSPAPRPGCDPAPTSEPRARHHLLQETALARRWSSLRTEAGPRRSVTVPPGSVGPARHGAPGVGAGTAGDLEEAVPGPRSSLLAAATPASHSPPHSPSETAAASPLQALATRSRFRFRRQVGSGSGAPLPRPGAAAAILAACFVSTSSYGCGWRGAKPVTHFRGSRRSGWAAPGRRSEEEGLRCFVLLESCRWQSRPK